MSSRIVYLVLAVSVVALLACGGGVDPDAIGPHCNDLSAPRYAEDQDVIGVAPFYSRTTAGGAAVPDGKYHLTVRRAWRERAEVFPPEYAGPLGLTIEVHGARWEVVENQAGRIWRHTYTVGAEDYRFLRFDPTCGGGSSFRYGVVREERDLALFAFVEGGGVPVEYVFAPE